VTFFRSTSQLSRLYGRQVKRDLGILRRRAFRNIFAARAVSLLGTSMAPAARASLPAR
jgi:hypothetical protein